ncbi:ionotropic receptor 21a [Drosophila eugracilis]|uniref:ionotropic receptor 21a n=1 Tax=Drosophila eugracilis TaxID=29029 RepID=UPI0007E67B1F|nr:ionotropic receptor 21a [Drosophila eugracilis]
MIEILVGPNYWSAVLSFLAQQYLTDSHATCIFWHPAFNFRLDTVKPLPLLIMDSQKWLTYPDDKDVYNYKGKRDDFEGKGIHYNNWTIRLTVAIEKSHCETFLAFQEQIPQFARYFYHASIYSIWRSLRNRFIFAYTEELVKENDNYLVGFIFQDQPNILVVTSRFLNSSAFDIKTNRFVGPRNFDSTPVAAELDVLQRYDAANKEKMYNVGMRTAMSAKMRNLKGREIVIGIFDYKPFMLLNYERQPFFYDRFENTTEVTIDGTDIRLMLIFCERYNCSIQVDTSETTDWGDIYPNASGYGLVGMVLNRRNDYGVGGMYLWYEAYQYMDMTHFLGRSGVTCLVPAPNRLISWTLLLRPFQTALWMGVILCLLLESLALCVTRRLEYSSGSHSNSWICSLRFGFIITLKLFVNQSTSYVTNSYALRTVLAASYMIDIIVTTVYSGGLAAILTLPTLEEAADSRQRLFDHKLIWTGTSQAWITTIDERSADPVLLGLMEHYRVYDAALISTFSHTEQMGFVVERMQFGHLGNTELIANDALERLKLMVDDIYFAFTVAFVPRLWPHLNSYNDFILAWHSSGLDQFWEWKIAADYMNAHRQNRIVASQRPNLDIGPVKLGIDNFIGLILLWCFGMIWSLLTFIGELWKGQDHTVL